MKNRLKFVNFKQIIDASEFGDLLVLSGADFLQGSAE